MAHLLARARLHRPDPRVTEIELAAPAGGCVAPPAGQALRVVTFNVHAKPPEALAQAILSSRSVAGADVFLLQEVERVGAHGDSQAHRLAERLGLHSAYAPAYARWDGGSHGVAILSRYPLRDLEVVELPRFDVIVNSARRIALGATVDTDRGALRTYSVHLDNRLNPAARLHQLAPALERGAEHDGAVVVGGDFNMGPFRWGARVLPMVWSGQARHVEAAMRARGYATPTISVGSTNRWLGVRLDALFTRGLTPLESAVDRSVRISDHLPLWLDVVPAAVGTDTTAQPAAR